MSLVRPIFVASIASHPDDDQHELNHQLPSADGDPTDSGNLLVSCPTRLIASYQQRDGVQQCTRNLQQLLLANWCQQVGGAVQLPPLLQLQEEAVTAAEHRPQQQQRHLA